MIVKQKIRDYIESKNKQFSEEIAEFSKRDILVIMAGAGAAGFIINKGLFGNRFKLRDLRTMAKITERTSNMIHEEKSKTYREVTDLFGGDVKDIPDDVIVMLRQRGDTIEEEVLSEFIDVIHEELGLDMNEINYIQRG